ncbi:MAG: hypothetical protein CMM01_19935 [Rhodopirellula sp.]|nr:hypothetical protein [Rhodopirellula sp.]
MAGPVIGTGAGCGIVTIVLVSLWLGVSAYVAYEASPANPIQGTTNGGSFVVWFLCLSVFYLIFLIPALLGGWLICGLIGWAYLTPPKSIAVFKPDVRKHNETSSENVPISLIMILGVAVVWFTVWCVTRDPWWFINGRDAFR